VKVNGVNLTYEGLIPRVQKSFLSKDREAMQPHIRAFVDRAVAFTACPECGGSRLNEAARSSRIGGINIADACAMQISDLAEWVRGLDEPSVAPLLATLQQTLDSFVEIGLGYLSLDRVGCTYSIFLEIDRIRYAPEFVCPTGSLRGWETLGLEGGARSWTLRGYGDFVKQSEAAADSWALDDFADGALEGEHMLAGDGLGRVAVAVADRLEEFLLVFDDVFELGCESGVALHRDVEDAQ
jgi:hypothetical protein